MLYALVDCSNRIGFGRISAEEILGEVKVVIPKFKERNSKEVAKRALKKMNEHGVENVVLSNNLNQNFEFCKMIEDSRKNVITGRRISKVLVFKIINEISKYTKYEKERMNILLLMHEYSLENMDLIEIISKEVKTLTLISRNYTKYEKLANRLFREYGVVVNLHSNEEIKDYKRISIVINLDFKSEEVRKILLPRNCIILSLNEKIDKLKRGFNGIIINDLDILGKENSPLNYRGLALCEARIYKPLRKLQENERIFNSEKYIINGYVGKNGKIRTEEFEKIFT